MCYQYVLITSVRIYPRVLGHNRTGVYEYTSRISGLSYRAEDKLQW